MHFRKGVRDGFEKLNDDALDQRTKSDIVREHMAIVFDAQNLSFLLGSGCSSFQHEDENGVVEEGIPTMVPLAKGFQEELRRHTSEEHSEPQPSDNEGDPSPEPEPKDVENQPHADGQKNKSALIKGDYEKIKMELGIDITSEDLSCNIESIMSSLISAHEYCRISGKNDVIQSIEKLIKFINIYIQTKCDSKKFLDNENCVLKTYKKFYECLGNRSRQNSPPWVFTSNYDLFNERAMDRLNIPYSNGFSGTVERRFNPATYRLTLAEQLDITSRRWATVDRFVHFCKLHGSVNWIDEGKGLYPIREMHHPLDGNTDRLMIYPTPSKQSASLSSPYSDMLREFHRQVIQDHSVLVVIGYGFGDEHINNIIFQGLTLPNFRIVIFASPEESRVAKELSQLEDPRIWLIWGKFDEDKERKSHYFDCIVDHFLPKNKDQLENYKIMQKTLTEILSIQKG